MESQNIYTSLAALFEYPGADYQERCAACEEQFRVTGSDGRAHLVRFLSGIEGLTTDELQELYTHTFDLNPVCSLEIGWHLYGEDYSRGDFMVKMRGELRRHEIAESSELPDHLTHALALMGRMPSEDGERFASGFLLPALDKMRKGWTQQRNAFAELLEAAFVLLKQRHAYIPERHPVRVPELTVLP